MNNAMASATGTALTSVPRVFLIFLRLGLTSFGGPIAHFGYLRHELVARQKWLDEHAFADLVALCQLLPGPASSEAVIALGLSRGGVLHAIAAWAGFTLPSALLLVLFGLGLPLIGSHAGYAWLHGLMLLTVAVVAQAIWNMGRMFCPNPARAAVALFSAATTLFAPTSLGQVAAIAMGAMAGCLLPQTSASLPHDVARTRIGKGSGKILLLLFFLLLILLPLIAAGSGNYVIKLFDSFYRAGALVFGGGHVVLPLLQAAVVPNGWVDNEKFLAGYGAAQAIPGPLFTFAAYLGAVSSQSPSGWAGGAIALIAIFLPSFLLITGILPFWEQLRRYSAIQRIMPGVNSAVVGILFAAFCKPVWTSTIHSLADFGLAATCLLLIVRGLPAWTAALLLVVATKIIAG